MALPIVIDTNVFISALRSRRGASFKLLSLCGIDARFRLNLSVPLTLEYEDVAKRQLPDTKLSEQDVDDIIDYLLFNSQSSADFLSVAAIPTGPEG